MATLFIGTWTRTVDADRTRRVLARELAFDEETMVGGHPADALPADPKPVAVR
ncbi:hypothetical protein [Nocardia rhizosphaerae]|uniref:Uncharacterized protein n=1 Tax=Nocardia rhizosphaerae TaxID=1691571 RepID=A0ABV8L5C2_9NOCA